nr:gliding motility protein GldN [Saprospiraceae bacterium]
MKKVFVIIALVFAAGAVMAQGSDDPFAPSGGGDPFATDPQPTTQPETQPVNEQPASDPFTTDAPTSTQETDTAGGSSDPFSGGSDPFSAGGVDSPLGGFGGGGGSADMLSRMSDTLIQPLRNQFPWEQRALQERQVLKDYRPREADIFWARTVWREIDIREKMNHPFANPNQPFITILTNIMDNNPDIKVYKHDPFSNVEFTEETTWDEVRSTLSKEEEYDVPIMNEETGEITYQTQTIRDKFNVGSVTRFQIKEVWYFDKKHSRMRVDIIGIAPIKQTTAAELGVGGFGIDSTGPLAEDPIFWIYYPDFREK